MGYLGGSESYKWGRMDNSLDPNPLTGKHDMVCNPSCDLLIALYKCALSLVVQTDDYGPFCAQWHNDRPGTDIAPLIGYSTSFVRRKLAATCGSGAVGVRMIRAV